MAPDKKSIDGSTSKVAEQKIKEVGNKIDLMLQKIDSLSNKVKLMKTTENAKVEIIRGVKDLMELTPQVLQEFLQEILSQSKIARQPPSKGQYNDEDFLRKRASAKEKKEYLEEQKKEFMSLVSKLGSEIQTIDDPGSILKAQDILAQIQNIINERTQKAQQSSQVFENLPQKNAAISQPEASKADKLQQQSSQPSSPITASVSKQHTQKSASPNAAQSFLDELTSAVNKRNQSHKKHPSQPSSSIMPTVAAASQQVQQNTPPLVEPKSSGDNTIENIKAKIAQAQQQSSVTKSQSASVSVHPTKTPTSQSFQHSAEVIAENTLKPKKTPPPVPPKPSRDTIEAAMAKIAQAKQQQHSLSSVINAKDRVVTSGAQHRQTQDNKGEAADPILQAFRELKTLINSLILEDESFKKWQEQNQNKTLDDFKHSAAQMDNLTPETKELISKLGAAGYANILGSGANIEQAQEMSFAASFCTLDWATQSNAVGNTTRKTITNEAGEKVVDLVSHSHSVQLSASVNGATKTITKCRTIDIPSTVEKGPLDLALVAQDSTGKNMPESKAVYFTVHYDQDGKIVEMTHPEPLKFFSETPSSPAYTVINGEIFTLPITKEKYEQLHKEISQNMEEQYAKDHQLAADKFTIGSSSKTSEKKEEEMSMLHSLKSIPPDGKQNKTAEDRSTEPYNNAVQQMIKSLSGQQNYIDPNEQGSSGYVKRVVQSIAPESKIKSYQAKSVESVNSETVKTTNKPGRGFVQREVQSIDSRSLGHHQEAQRLLSNLTRHSSVSSSSSVVAPVNTAPSNNKLQPKGRG
ncbi:surface antigen family protein [Orientia chuto str. Dubai]|uniref:Antigenic heat-stable 120 kDa protein n=1 Tax=Orientia chuto str. Dubai TaxID=1359168 RepID=A0A0F3MK43_9RICK|nr:Sca4 family protein [Candidatus Orientia mediorientalis]KJV56095.1 surface antigen family protein [Orientia chuto str. Dubai]